MSKELEALSRIETAIHLGLKHEAYFKVVDVTVNFDKGAILNDVTYIKTTLKRNEPMKVDLKTKYALPYSGTYYTCPKCGITIIKRYYNCCPNCEQKLDWSEKLKKDDNGAKIKTKGKNYE